MIEEIFELWDYYVVFGDICIIFYLNMFCECKSYFFVIWFFLKKEINDIILKGF